MSRAIVWFRQDLRLQDNPALAKACDEHEQVMCLYILEDIQTVPIGGAQQWWLHHSIIALQQQLQSHGLVLTLRLGHAEDILCQLAQENQIQAIYWNRLYEPAHQARDTKIKVNLQNKGIDVFSFNGSLLNEPWTVKNQAGDFFKVYTPFWKQCLRQMDVSKDLSVKSWPKPIKCDSEQLENWHLCPTKPNWAKDFARYWQPGSDGAWQKLITFLETHLNDYQHARDCPSLMATSRLSPHLHFGEISPAQIWRATQDLKNDPAINHQSVEHFLAELGWREFSYHLLYHFPALNTDNFRREFDAFPWQDNQEALRCWQQGKTGYPIIDAGMKELWQTGYMHNRVRMIVASFLTKDLLIDWRQGATWFDDTLLDADQANNYASWQWTAGCGADAAPYFRIFNPILQGEKFDPEGHYVRRFIPALTNVPNKWLHKPWLAPESELPIQLGRDYPIPIVDHQQARKTALQYYGKLKQDK
jgi:deoxyribodipyrimidine photo-lyase